jgi:hypothetical protein
MPMVAHRGMVGVGPVVPVLVDLEDAAVVRKIGRGGKWLVDGRQYTTEEDRAHCVRCLAEFLRKFPKIKMVPSRWKHTHGLLHQGGHPDDEICTFLRDYFFMDRRAPGMSINGEAFDHGEMWGGGGTPLFLIGHPYTLGGRCLDSLDGFRRLGLTVHVDAKSWHSILTLRVVVFHLAMIRRVFQLESNDFYP